MAKIIVFDFDGTANTRKGAETIDRWLAGGDIIHLVTARTHVLPLFLTSFSFVQSLQLLVHLSCS